MLAIIAGVGGRHLSQGCLICDNSCCSCWLLRNRESSIACFLLLVVPFQRLLSVDVTSPYFLATATIQGVPDNLNSIIAASIAARVMEIYNDEAICCPPRRVSTGWVCAHGGEIFYVDPRANGESGGIRRFSSDLKPAVIIASDRFLSEYVIGLRTQRPQRVVGGRRRLQRALTQ
jgi:hypothetical protein